MMISVDARRNGSAAWRSNPIRARTWFSPSTKKSSTLRSANWKPRCSRPTPKPARWSWRIPTPEKFWRWRIGPTFNPNLSREITPQTKKPRSKRHLRARIDIQASNHCRRAGREIDPPRRNFDCQMGSIVVNGMRIHDSNRWGYFSWRKFWRIERSRRNQDRRSAWAKSGFTNTFAPSDSDSRPVSNSRRNSRHDQAGESLVKSFDCGHFDGPGNRSLAASAGPHGFDHCQRWRLDCPADRCRHHRSPSTPQTVAFHPGSAATGDLADDSRADETDDAGSHADRHGTGKRRFSKATVRRENRHRAES